MASKIWGLVPSRTERVRTRYSGPTNTGRGSRIIVTVRAANGSTLQRTFPYYHGAADAHAYAIAQTFETFGKQLTITRDHQARDTNNDRRVYLVSVNK